MNLDTLFSIMKPFLEGRATHAEAASALYGNRADHLSAARLGIYAHGYEHNVRTAAERMAPLTKAAIVARRGENTWRELIRRYVPKYPMKLIRFGAEHLPAHITECADDLELPGWLAELADLEQWDRRVALAPNPAPATRLSLADPFELRDYHYDLVTWMRQGDAARAPEPGLQLLALFRPEEQVRRLRVRPVALAVLRAVNAGADEQRITAGGGALGTPDKATAILSSLISMGVLRRP